MKIYFESDDQKDDEVISLELLKNEDDNVVYISTGNKTDYENGTETVISLDIVTANSLGQVLSNLKV